MARQAPEGLPSYNSISWLKRADAARRGAAALIAGFDARVAGDGVDHDALAVDDVLALADHDIAGQGDGLGNELIDAEVAAGILVLGDDGDAAARFASDELILNG
jgi:hypothetical protein